MSLTIAQALTKELPKQLPGFLFHARALHKMGKTHEAYHLLVDVVELFPDNQTIRYDIACYAAQRGLTEESIEWLKLCFKTDADGEFRNRALDDPMLAKVWEHGSV